MLAWGVLCGVLISASWATTIEELGLDPRPTVKCNKYNTLPNTCENFARINIGKIHLQINQDLNTSYTFLAMANYFGRDDKAYRGFSKFFQHLAHEEREQANGMMTYLNKRGGLLHLKPIQDPKSEWDTPLEAIRDCMWLVKNTLNSLLDLHWDAASKNDPHLQHFLEVSRLSEKVEVIKQLSDYITILSRVEPHPFGTHLFDQQLLEGTR